MCFLEQFTLLFILFIKSALKIIRFHLKIVLFFLLLSSHSLANINDILWESINRGTGVSLWKLKENTKVIITHQSKKRDKKINWNEIHSKEFFSAFEKRKKKFLNIIGVSQWKSTKYQWFKRLNYFELIVNGTYINGSEEKIAFKEIHLFMSKKTEQILLTRPYKEKVSPIITNRLIHKIKGRIKND